MIVDFGFEEIQVDDAADSPSWFVEHQDSVTSFLSFLQLVPRHMESCGNALHLFVLSHAGTTGDDCLREEEEEEGADSLFLFSLNLLLCIPDSRVAWQ